MANLRILMMPKLETYILATYIHWKVQKCTSLKLVWKVDVAPTFIVFLVDFKESGISTGQQKVQNWTYSLSLKLIKFFSLQSTIILIVLLHTTTSRFLFKSTQSMT